MNLETTKIVVAMIAIMMGLLMQGLAIRVTDPHKREGMATRGMLLAIMGLITLK